METLLKVEDGIPLIETRGRTTSAEYLKLIEMRVGQSFVSKKSRDSLYQIARNQKTPVSIKSAGRLGWRVWKTGETGSKLTPKPRKPYQRLAPRASKSLRRKAKAQ
jgi:hypothetical protein